MNDLYLSEDLQKHKLRYQAELDREVMLVSKKEQRDLWMRHLDGDVKATQALWLQGVRMVSKLVKKFIQLGKILPGDEMDAIQAGNLAIGENLSDWSPNRGAFSTFMWVCIRGALIDFNDKESKHGLTGDFAFEDVQITEMEGRRGDDNKNDTGGYLITDWLGLGHDLDIDELALFMDYDKVLDGQEREILDMWLFRDYSQDQIAAVVGMSRPTVTRIARAGLDKMKEAYSKSI